MRMGSRGRLATVSAVAGVLMMAAGGLAATMPASAATAASAAKLSGRESAQLTLGNVGDGVTIGIRGGGSGTSNCTSDETNKEIWTGSSTGPVQETLSFETRGSGSCFFEPSWSQFKITVTGTNTRGYQYMSSATVEVGQPRPGAAFRSSCRPDQERMTCQTTGPLSFTLDAVPLNHPSSLKTGSWVSAAMVLSGAGTGPQVAIQGGGAGTSNCSSDETTKSFMAQTDPIRESLSFDARGSGSCLYERSYSFYKITVKGQNTDGLWFDSSANVFFGQEYSAASPYVISCESRYLVRMFCTDTEGRLALRPEPFR